MFFLVFILGVVLAIMIGVRYYVLEPVRMQDNSLHPRFKKNSILWMCKLPRCTESIVDGDFVWGIMRNQDNMVRRVLGVPGDSITITNNGKVYTQHRNFKWNGEDAFIETRSFYVPRKGDTLHFDKLNDVEQDYLISLMHEQNEKFYVKSSLWQGKREMPLERIGSTKLGNRLVSLQEIDYMPWQDRFLVELQIFLAEPGNTPIHIKRELYSAKDSSKISYYVVPEDCYYLICEKSNHCADSREIGYFTKNRLLGRANKAANKIQKQIDDRIFRAQNAIKKLLKGTLQKADKKPSKKPKQGRSKKETTKT
ncbi:signal peptidase I [Fibrobacter succinogenes subsp. elongatus]|uniref:Signal peptidase I n=1 Tax=Fibrobacter succinogenes TaxID=833 RepID=A0A380RWG6_FIBSU|nr:signal peptidase I [Fibrobacter succinogenes subsp. elongatus]SUQ19222.1 Signal peptidase I [Fibrobacter succinogenes]